MKLFRKDSNYAVRTLIFIAQGDPSKPISSTCVSENLGIPKSFLRRIFSKLIQAGILLATEGVRGGVVLAKPPATITVGEIVFALQGGVRICNCFQDHRSCSEYETCPIKSKIIAMESLLTQAFHAISIQTLIDESG